MVPDLFTSSLPLPLSDSGSLATAAFSGDDLREAATRFGLIFDIRRDAMPPADFWACCIYGSNYISYFQILIFFGHSM